MLQLIPVHEVTLLPSEPITNVTCNFMNLTNDSFVRLTLLNICVNASNQVADLITEQNAPETVKAIEESVPQAREKKIHQS